MFATIKSVILAFILLFVLPSCKNNNDKGNKINLQLIKSFNESNTSITQSTSSIIKALEDMTSDPVKTERATPWFEKAISINQYTRILIQFIDSAANKEITQKEIDLIYDKVVAYKSSILQTDVEIAEIFVNQFNFINQFFALTGRDSIPKNAIKKLNISNEETILFLAALKNKAWNLENKFIQFCKQKVPSYNDGFESYSLIVSQNAQTLSPGSVLQINAGVGAFSFASKPVILFGGKNVLLSEGGYAEFRKKVPNTPGTYKIPVNVSFFNVTTGKQENVEVDIEYKVVKPCD